MDAVLTTTAPTPFGEAPFRRALGLLRHGHVPSELRWTTGAVIGRGPSTASLARWALAGATFCPQRCSLADELIRSWPGRIADSNLAELTDDEIYLTVRRSIDGCFSDRCDRAASSQEVIHNATTIASRLAPDGLIGLSRTNANLFLCTLYEHLGPDRRMRLPRKHLLRLASEGAPTWPALACLLSVNSEHHSNFGLNADPLVDFPAWAAVSGVVLAVGANPSCEPPVALALRSDLRIYVLLNDEYWDLGDTASRHDEATVRTRRAAVAERALADLGGYGPLVPLLRQLRCRLSHPKRRS